MRRNLVKWLNLVDDAIRSAVWAALDDQQRELVPREGRYLKKVPQL